MKKFFVAMLSALMTVSMVFVAVADSRRVSVPVVAPNMSKQIEDVTGKFDFDSALDSALRDDGYGDYAVNTKGPRSVIVELSGASVLETFNSLQQSGGYDSAAEFALSSAGKSISSELKSEQKAFLAALKREKIDYTLKYNYSGIINAVALTVDSSDISAISKIKGVENVIYSETYYAPSAEAVMNQVNAYSTGIYNTDGISYTGAGMVVAVLDTGLDYTHNAFRQMPEVQSLTKDKVEAAVKSGTLAAKAMMESVTADELYMNAKVPFQFDYADNDADVYPVTSSHGTHVAGIIAGYEENVDYEIMSSDENMYFDTDENGNKRFSGVAVDAQLAIFKVFSDLGEQGAPTEAIIAALNDAVVLGVDIINMSLGSDAGFARSTDEEAVNEVYDRIREAGITLAVAAGNSYSSSYGGTYGNTNLTSNPDSSTVGSPSVYNGTISVASISGQLSPYLLINGKVAAYFINGKAASGKDYDFTELLLDGAEKKTFDYVVVGGYGEAHNYTQDVREKLAKGNCIAVVRRGTSSFEDKQRVAAQYGAVGCIIYNNVSGTISASLGTGYRIPTCTVTMDIANQFVSQTYGTIELCKDYKAGPFMSEFSSWGASPDLQLYPDITAHGGYITSAVLGGYGVYSGTSMATPNIAGISTLFRQHLVEKYPDLSKVQINDMLYQILMSTATMARNEDGDPYSPRKQGAGLADINNSINTDAYMYVKGTNKTKVELGDDPSKSGNYTLRFNFKNTSSSERKYEMSSYVMTEKVSSDGITVAEKAYVFSDAKVRIAAAENGISYSGNTVTLAPGADAQLTVQIVLTSSDKAYLDANFKNGMFVEGYLRFTDMSAANKVDLGIPYMGFYGDWLDAPMFDHSAYDVSGSKFDESVPQEDKLKADLYESIVIGKYYRENGDRYMPLGEYIFNLPENRETQIESSVDKIAVSNNDYGIYELYGVYAGLLRGAKSMKVAVSDSVTGEVIYERTNYEVRKSVEGKPGPVLIELDPDELGLKSNTKYDVKLTGAIDYENGENVSRNSWDFSFYTDYEVPYVVDSNVRVSYDNNKNKTVNLDLYLYDNHYVQSLQLFTWVGKANDPDIEFLTEYPIEVNSSFGGTTRVTVDITEYLDNFVNAVGSYANNIGVYISDYALNQGGYRIPINWSELTDLSLTDTDGLELNSYEDGVEVGLGMPFDFNVKVGPDKADWQALNYTLSDPSVAEIKDGVIFGRKVGETAVTVTSKHEDSLGVDAEKTIGKYTFTVKVTDDGQTHEYPLRSVKFASYQRAGETERVITDNRVSLDCGTVAKLRLDYTPWYATNTDQITWTSVTQRTVSVTADGVITALNEGVGYVRVSWKYNNVNFESMLTVNIGKKYELLSGYIYRYHGADKVLQIPSNLGGIYLGHFNDDTAGPLSGDKNVKVAIVPSGIKNIGRETFAGCTALETVYLPATLEGIGYGAFKDCKKLKNIYWFSDAYYNTDLGYYTYVNAGGATVPCFDENGNYMGGFTGKNGVAESAEDLTECTAKNLYLWNSAFESCSALTAFDLSKTTAVYENAFKDCTSLKKADARNIKNAGESAFAGCSGITELLLGKDTVLGVAMFQNCNSITSVDIYSSAIGAGAFFNCKGLRTVNIHNDLIRIGEQAFAGCTALTALNVAGSVGEIEYRAFYGAALSSADISVANIGARVFEGCTRLTSVTLRDTAVLGDYAFLGCSALRTVTIGEGTTLDTIGLSPFNGCTSFTDFAVSRNNRNFRIKRDNGYTLLYNADATKLLLAPTGYAPSAGYNFNGLTTIGSSAYANSGISVDTLVIPEGITEIGDFAFGFNRFSTVILPASLETIGVGAFYGCANLKSVVFLGDKVKTLPSSLFYGCTSLVSVDLPRGLETINAGAFYGCSALGVINIPASVGAIGNNAFAGCTSLKTVKFDNASRLETIGSGCFMSAGITDIQLPATLKTLGDGAFAGCSALTEITIPGALENWGSLTFLQCTSLKNVVIEEGVKYVGSYAFAFVDTESGDIYYNTALKTVVLPSTLTDIRPYAFAACNALESIDLRYVQVVYDSAFMGCTALKDLGNTDKVFYLGAQAFTGCSALVSVDMPGVLTIGNYAFQNCASLTSVNFPSAQIVANFAFRNCAELANVNMPEVRRMFSMVFYNCAALTEIDLPKIEMMGQGVFFGCGLTSFNIPASLTDMDVANFMACLSLEEITVDENNPVYFTDGVAVYRKLSNGHYEAVAYPNARGGKYSILEGTVRIADYAFAYSVTLNYVELPGTIKSVGAQAFYYVGLGTDSITYVFKSLQAPALECFASSEGRNAVYLYYNFTHGFGRVRTNIKYPANGLGYNSYIYQTYFNLDETLPAVADETTLLVIDRINNLDKATATAEEVASIRSLINTMSETQKNLVTNYGKFVDIESSINARPEPTPGPEVEKGFPLYGAVLISVFATLAVCCAAFVLYVWFMKKRGNAQ